MEILLRLVSHHFFFSCHTRFPEELLNEKEIKSTLVVTHVDYFKGKKVKGCHVPLTEEHQQMLEQQIKGTFGEKSSTDTGQPIFVGKECKYKDEKCVRPACEHRFGDEVFKTLQQRLLIWVQDPSRPHARQHRAETASKK